MTNTPEFWILLAGVLQLSLLIAGALLPGSMDWKGELRKLAPLMRQLFLVYSAYVVGTILVLGLVVVFNAGALASGAPLARALAIYLTLFWGVRLLIQMAVFDPEPYFTHPVLRVGERSLCGIFTYLTIIYGATAVLL